MPNQTKNPQNRTRNGKTTRESSEQGELRVLRRGTTAVRQATLRKAEPRMHPITFCVSCQEAIPAKAITCFRCNAKQPHGEDAVQVVFCDKCEKDYPARALSCHHCGHLNARHPLVRGGSIAS